MNCKRFLSILILFTLLSGMLLFTGHAALLPSLPSTPVSIQVVDGTTSHFITRLGEVPLGYNVSDGKYAGWCVDASLFLPRAPENRMVILYSSLNPPSNAPNLTGPWNMVNYILNHRQGDANDTQAAIWYFINGIGGPQGYYTGEYYPPSNATQAMVADALANGKGFVPNANQKQAVICYPYPSFQDTQLSIIELSMPVQSVQNGHLPLEIIIPAAIIIGSLIIAVLAVKRRRNRK
jgi:hypothetical protein